MKIKKTVCSINNFILSVLILYSTSNILVFNDISNYNNKKVQLANMFALSL